MSRDNPTPPEFLWSKRETDKRSSFLNLLAWIIHEISSQKRKDALKG